MRHGARGITVDAQSVNWSRAISLPVLFRGTSGGTLVRPHDGSCEFTFPPTDLAELTGRVVNAIDCLSSTCGCSITTISHCSRRIASTVALCKMVSARATINVSGQQLSRRRRMILAFLIAKAMVQSAGSLWAIRDILLVFTGKATLNVSTHFPKYNAHRLDTGADHVWIDDTDLYIWIPFFRIGGLGVMVWMLVLIKRESTTEACTCG